jgi:hypothetical protein
VFLAGLALIGPDEVGHRMPTNLPFSELGRGAAVIARSKVALIKATMVSQAVNSLC